MNLQPTVSVLNITIEDLRFFEGVFQNFDKIADLFRLIKLVFKTLQNLNNVLVYQTTLFIFYKIVCIFCIEVNLLNARLIQLIQNLAIFSRFGQNVAVFGCVKSNTSSRAVRIYGL